MIFYSIVDIAILFIIIIMRIGAVLLGKLT